MKRTHFSKIMVIGSGPIIIGQAAEFDYSGTQACRVLMDEGIETVLVNSNPATIMTDTRMADSVYIEPLNTVFLEKIIAKERPQGILAGMGGQTALNLALELDEKGILKKYGVELLGTNLEAIRKSEDRELFKHTMERIGQPVIESDIFSTVEGAVAYADSIGYPVVVRPAFTLGGTGGGIAYTRDELLEIAPKGIAFSMASQILIEKFIKGWKEIEYEMIRDAKGNVIVVCNMENIDPVGIHTGDSIVVAPSQTLSDREYQMLRNSSIAIVTALDIVGGCNVQYALDPLSFNYFVIEVNPRVSRSSALASKATGYPIAKVAAKIAIGYSLEEITNDVTGKTMASFEPTLDYCVVKIPKWPFDKLDSGKRRLGTMMMATGEVMAIGNRFESALLKGIRSLEIRQDGLLFDKAADIEEAELKRLVKEGDDERIYYLAEMLRRGYEVAECSELSMIDPFFVHKILNIIQWEESIRGRNLAEIDEDEMRFLKQRGFSDKTIARLTGSLPDEVYEARKAQKVTAVYKMVDTCGGEFDAVSNYFYSTYDHEDESIASDREKVLVIGSGPIRIGQGVEFDYCSVHGVLALREMGYEAIIVNNNPETVSTDFDISDKLYFEPITEEDVLNIIEKEKPIGVILQYGGQTAIKLAEFLSEKGIRILGTSAADIDASENREVFEAVMEKFDIKRPKGVAVMTMEEGMKAAEELGYPVLVRPSYVLGGLGMEIAYNASEIEAWLELARSKNPKKPVLIDKYLNGIEIEVDAICDGTDILIPGIMEHLERAGIHSGDSVSIYPAPSLSAELKAKIVKVTETLARVLNVVGLINIQYVYADGELYVIEVNPRASRTVPFISKVTGISMIEVATRAMLGMPLKNLRYGTGLFPESSFYSVKVPVFSMDKIPGSEIALGPEMKSTGEVLSIEADLTHALYKGFIAAKMELPEKGKILASISEHYKEEFIALARDMAKLGYEFAATPGTAQSLRDAGIEAETVTKIGLEGVNVIDMIRSGAINWVVNIPSKGRDSRTDGFKIRRAAVEKKIPCLTALDTLEAWIQISKANIQPEDLAIVNICDLTLALEK